MESEKLKIYQNRLLTANLINDVLIGKKTVLEALSKFPNDKNDINIKCAFDALAHREADEEIRLKDKEYALVQDDFLIEIATILKNNEQLPQNIISSYLKYHRDDLIPNKEKTFRDIINYLKKMINF